METNILFIFLFFILIIDPIYYQFILERYRDWKSKKEKPVEVSAPVVHISQSSIAISNDILKFIDDLIEHEILYCLYQIAALDKKYDIRRLDVDIKSVADKVYHGLNPSILNESMLMPQESLMRYITERTTYSFTSNVLKYNSTH